MPKSLTGLTRCPVCEMHMAQHRRGAVAWCINPKCRRRDELVANKRAQPVRSYRRPRPPTNARQAPRHGV